MLGAVGTDDRDDLSPHLRSTSPQTCCGFRQQGPCRCQSGLPQPAAEWCPLTLPNPDPPHPQANATAEPITPSLHVFCFPRLRSPGWTGASNDISAQWDEGAGHCFCSARDEGDTDGGRAAPRPSFRPRNPQQRQRVAGGALGGRQLWAFQLAASESHCFLCGLCGGHGSGLLPAA